MAIRELINKHPKVTASVLFMGVLATIGYAMAQLRTGPPGTTEFYSDDDGKTWFADTAGRIVPYQRDGKEVVIATVFKSDTKPAYCAYLQRYTADSLKEIQKSAPNAQPGDALPAQLSADFKIRLECKKPGDTKWRDIEGNSKAMSQYIVLSSGDGSQLTEVEP